MIAWSFWLYQMLKNVILSTTLTLGSLSVLQCSFLESTYSILYMLYVCVCILYQAGAELAVVGRVLESLSVKTPSSIKIASVTHSTCTAVQGRVWAWHSGASSLHTCHLTSLWCRNRCKETCDGAVTKKSLMSPSLSRCSPCIRSLLLGEPVRQHMRRLGSDNLHTE